MPGKVPRIRETSDKRFLLGVIFLTVPKYAVV